MYEHRMKLFDGHFISTLSSAFCLYKNGRKGEPLGMEISGAQGICRK